MSRRRNSGRSTRRTRSRRSRSRRSSRETRSRRNRSIRSSSSSSRRYTRSRSRSGSRRPVQCRLGASCLLGVPVVHSEHCTSRGACPTRGRDAAFLALPLPFCQILMPLRCGAAAHRPTHSPCSKYGLSSSMMALITSYLTPLRCGAAAQSLLQDLTLGPDNQLR